MKILNKDLLDIVDFTRSGTAYGEDENGDIVSFATNTPRLVFSGGERQGLLVEDTVTYPALFSDNSNAWLNAGGGYTEFTSTTGANGLGGVRVNRQTQRHRILEYNSSNSVINEILTTFSDTPSATQTRETLTFTTTATTVRLRFDALNEPGFVARVDPDITVTPSTTYTVSFYHEWDGTYLKVVGVNITDTEYPVSYHLVASATVDVVKNKDEVSLDISGYDFSDGFILYMDVDNLNVEDGTKLLMEMPTVADTDQERHDIVFDSQDTLIFRNNNSGTPARSVSFGTSNGQNHKLAMISTSGYLVAARNGTSSVSTDSATYTAPDDVFAINNIASSEIGSAVLQEVRLWELGSGVTQAEAEQIVEELTA